MLVKIYKKYKTEIGEPTILELEPTGSIKGRFKYKGVEYEILEFEDEKERKFLKRQEAIAKEEYESNSSLYKGYYDTTPNSLTDSLEAVQRGDFNYHNPNPLLIKQEEKDKKIDSALRKIMKLDNPIIVKGATLRHKFREAIRIGIDDTTHPMSYPKNIHKKYIVWRNEFPDSAEQLDNLVKSYTNV